MQRILIFLSFIFIFGFQAQLKAQTKDFSKSSSFQSTIGFGKSLHYFTPVQIRCEECPVEKQEGRIVHQVEMALFRQFRPNQEYSFGFGTARYRFFEKGFNSLGGGLLPYERIVKRIWIQLHLGHRYTFPQKRKRNLFIENGIITDWKAGKKSSYLKTVGISYRLRVGLQYEPVDGIKLFLNGYYKTAIIKYNKETIGDKNYFPYNYGIEIGATTKIIRNKK